MNYRVIHFQFAEQARIVAAEHVELLVDDTGCNPRATSRHGRQHGPAAGLRIVDLERRGGIRAWASAYDVKLPVDGAACRVVSRHVKGSQNSRLLLSGIVNFDFG